MTEINTKAFGLCGAIQGAKETIGLYADGSDTLEANFAKELWNYLDRTQQILKAGRPGETRHHAGQSNQSRQNR